MHLCRLHELCDATAFYTAFLYKMVSRAIKYLLRGGLTITSTTKGWVFNARPTTACKDSDPWRDVDDDRQERNIGNHPQCSCPSDPSVWGVVGMSTC